MNIPKGITPNSINKSNEKITEIAVIGNPNSGKTTLFNRLTGSQQTTGNWPGVTVEQKTGSLNVAGCIYNITDLPGINSLESCKSTSLDEKVSISFLQNNQSLEVLLNVVDATNLERQLFLTTQLLHMELPVVVVLNRMDLLKSHNIDIDVDALANKLGCPVIPISAYYNKGVDELKSSLKYYLNHKSKFKFELPEPLNSSVREIQQYLDSNKQHNCCHSLNLLSNTDKLSGELHKVVVKEKQVIEQHCSEDISILVADLYFQYAHEAAHAAIKRLDKFNRNTTDIIDSWVLHPRWGIFIFMLIIYSLFSFSVVVGNIFIDFFDQASKALFVDLPTHLLQATNTPNIVINLIADGIGGGIHIVSTFIPVIGALFLFLSILEDTGYMQRASLIMDRSMRKLGLSGKSFVPLVVGFGCNVPSVLAARTINDQRSRIMTIMMTPFMSCSARLTVYMLFATAFFVDNSGLLVFSLYLIGIIAAVATALLLKNTLLVSGENPPLLIELPLYHKPTVINVLLNTRNKLRSFVFNAGKIIIIVVVFLSIVDNVSTDFSIKKNTNSESILHATAKMANPVVKPLGITEDNWPATIGLITGFLAKEVVVGTLDSLYQRIHDDSTGVKGSSELLFFDKLIVALATIPSNISNFFADITNPLGINVLSNILDKEKAAEQQGVHIKTIDKMASNFDGAIGAFAYLLFVLLYFPCVATFAAIKQELGWKWALFGGAWGLFLGYSVSVMFYQIATWYRHPNETIFWVTIFSSIYILLFFYLKHLGKKKYR